MEFVLVGDSNQLVRNVGENVPLPPARILAALERQDGIDTKGRLVVIAIFQDW